MANLTVSDVWAPVPFGFVPTSLYSEETRSLESHSDEKSMDCVGVAVNVPTVVGEEVAEVDSVVVGVGLWVVFAVGVSAVGGTIVGEVVGTLLGISDGELVDVSVNTGSVFANTGNVIRGSTIPSMGSSRKMSSKNSRTRAVKDSIVQKLSPLVLFDCAIA